MKESLCSYWMPLHIIIQWHPLFTLRSHRSKGEDNRALAWYRVHSSQSLWLEIVYCPASHGFPGPYHIMFDVKPVYNSWRLCLNKFRATILKHSITLRRIENLFSETGIHGICPCIKTLGLSHKIIVWECLSARFAADTEPFARHQGIVETFCRNGIDVDIYAAERV